MLRIHSHIGVIAAVLIISIWCACIFLLMQWEFDWSNPLIYLFLLIQTYLYTGLFITAHDAMHGTVSSDRAVNNAVGQLCTFLYALFSFKKLYKKHHQHHRNVHTAADPDYHQGSFIVWYFNFIKEYLSWWQIVLMAVIYNILKILIPEPNLFLFWIAPSLLSTLQLFYFGTWLPHHGEHSNQHQSGTQQKNHILAFFSCYFFGYHYEHHDSPGTPWWKLWKMKDPDNSLNTVK